MLKDLSVEYAHIYTNDHISEEHELSLKVLQEVTNGLNNESISIVVLVDDYSFPDPAFNYESFSSWLSEKGYRPDLMLRESQLIPVCDEVLKVMSDEKIREELSSYIRKKKYPCSLFIAAWYLLRLGHLANPIFDESLVAKRIVNILPLSFKPYEDKARDIITSTPFKNALENIDNKYFEGRSIK